MSETVLYVSMSLDGFIAGPHSDHDNALGIDGHRLHDWLAGDKDVLVHGARTAQSALRASPTSATA